MGKLEEGRWGRQVRKFSTSGSGRQRWRVQGPTPLGHGTLRSLDATGERATPWSTGAAGGGLHCRLSGPAPGDLPAPTDRVTFNHKPSVAPMSPKAGQLSSLGGSVDFPLGEEAAAKGAESQSRGRCRAWTRRQSWKQQPVLKSDCLFCSISLASLAQNHGKF